MALPPYQLTPPPTQKSWLDRHGSWKIPLGCLGIVVLLAAFATGIFTIVRYSFHKSYVFNEAIARAERNPQVVSRIGTPLKPDWLPQGSIQVSGGAGTAQMTIPVTGPRGQATIGLDARKVSGTWHFRVLEVQIEGQTESVNLLEPADGTGQPER